MRDDTDAILDDLLVRWHHYCKPALVGRGFNRRALVVGDYVTSSQYDVENGALDEAIERRIMKDLDFQIAELPALFCIAIHANARALYIGVSVFTNPRLPADRAEREQVVRDARAALLLRVLSAGVM